MTEGLKFSSSATIYHVFTVEVALQYTLNKGVEPGRNNKAVIKGKNACARAFYGAEAIRPRFFLSVSGPSVQ